MSTVLGPGQKLKRQVKVYGVDLPVIVTLTHEGLEFKVKGSKLGITAPWTAVVNVCSTPTNVPSKLEGRPYEFLKDVATKITARLIKRLDKEAKDKKDEA